MAHDMIPPGQAAALAWMETFAAGVATAPATYHLTVPRAAAITAAVDAFAAAYVLALSPASRTAVTVLVKDELRISAEGLCRQVAGEIKIDAAIADSDKIAIGVKPPNRTRTPIQVPETSPLLNIVAATPGVQELRYHDASAPTRAAKPRGAAQLQLFCAVGAAPLAHPRAADFRGAFTRNPVTVKFGAGDAGKVATYFARWSTARGATGPWSLPVSMHIAA
ncbi:MAG TPA: hypothetical protein VIL86_20115 [Tepidisphaeraceae bacterium]|jgi:hypothetical protein